MYQKIKFIILSIVSLFIGMKVTLKNMFARRVTFQYPYEKRPMTRYQRGMVDLIPEDCVICYQCIKICPVAALDLRHKQVTGDDGKKKNEITKFTYNAELCCFCNLCEEICPTDAIFLNKMYEVSVYSHEETINIDLMTSDKYKKVNPNYDFALEAKKMEKLEAKPSPGPAPKNPVSSPTEGLHNA